MILFLSGMRILQLTPRVPFPPTDGGRVAMLQCAQGLQRAGARVRILSLNPRRQHADPAAAKRMLAPIEIEAVGVDTSAFLRPLLRAHGLAAPVLVARFFTPSYRDALRRTLAAERFDVVQLESPFLLPYLADVRELSPALVVMRAANVEFRIWEQLATSARSAPQRVMRRLIARTLRDYEVAGLARCDAVVPITEDDARDFRALGVARPMHVLPAGVDPHVGHSPTREESRSVGFLGSLDYRPNQEAAVWIAEELAPRLRHSMASPPEIHVAGSRPPGWLRQRLAAAGVTVEQDVGDVEEFFGRMRVLLAPVFTGGGMRIKALEALARGKAVVSTLLGAAGIDVVDGQHLLIAEDADAFAVAVARLLEEPALAARLGNSARSRVTARYSTDGLAAELLEFYERLLRPAG